MYQASEEWDKAYYDNNIQQTMDIYIDDIKIDENYITGFSIGHDLFSDNNVKLGSTCCKYIKFKIHKDNIVNKNKIKVDYGLIIDEKCEKVPLGQFNVEQPKEDNETLEITANDNMIKFESEYDGSNLIYPQTLMNVLKDICNKKGVELGSTSFLNEEKLIAVYDNTLTAREYISYIAEQAGGYAFIGRDGKLYIRSIGEDSYEVDLKLFKDFNWGNHYKISKVSYEDGTRAYKIGTEENNTLNINPNNMYIVDEEQIVNIYNKVNNLEIYGFEGEIKINPAWDVGDILIIDGKPVVCQYSADLNGRFIGKINSKVKSKQQEECTSKINEKTRIRRIQSTLDQATAELKLLAQQTEENEGQISTLILNLNGIKQEVSNITDYKREVDGVTQICLTEAGEAEILSLEVKGNKTYNNYLYPSENLFPSEKLFPNMEGSELM